MVTSARLTCRVSLLLVLLAPFAGLFPTRITVMRADAVRIVSIVVSPNDASLQYGVDVLQDVVRSTDSGKSWTPVLGPGDAQAPDPSTPGACLPGNYDRVAFLAVNPLRPRALYVGTVGVVGDYLDNGCGNVPGGLFFSLDGAGNFQALNHGLPADVDARGGGPAWSVVSLVFDPRDQSVLYAVTAASFLTIPGDVQSSSPAVPGVYRTASNGSQWDPAYTGIATTVCRSGLCRNPGSLAIVPDQTRVLLYAADSGFYRSEDRGNSWRRTGVIAFGGRSRFLVRVDPYETQLAYVVSNRAYYRSSDGGLSLVRLDRSRLPAPADVLDVTFDRGTPPRLTLVLSGNRQVTVRDTGPAPGPAATPGLVASATPSVTLVVTPSVTLVVTPSPAVNVTPTLPATRTVSTAIATHVTARATPTGVVAHTLFSANAGWPMVGHDAGQSYADPVGSIAPSALPRLRVRWQAAGESPQIVADGTVYVTDALGHVQARDAASGVVRHAYQSSNVQGLAFNAPFVYFNRGSEICIVKAATADWAHSAVGGMGNQSASFDSFVLSGNVIFTGIGPGAGGQASATFAFDAKSGRQLWQRPGFQSSVPCVAGAALYLGFGAMGSGDSYILRAGTGAIERVMRHIGTAQWHAAGDMVYASVLSGGSRLRAAIHAYDRAGHERWVAHDILFGASIPAILFGITPGAVDARSAVDGHRLWKSNIQGLQSVGLGSLVVSGSMVIVQATDGRLSVLDRDTGRLLRTLDPPVTALATGNLIVGNSMVFEGLIRAGTKESTLVAFAE